MASILLGSSNIAAFVNGELVSIMGKNGFTATLGDCPLLVNNFVSVDVSGSHPGNVELFIPHLNNAFDTNFNKHLLNVNDGAFLGLKGNDYITLEVDDKIDTGETIGFVGFNPLISTVTAKVVSFDLVTNKIKIENFETEGIKLIDKIIKPPFYTSISQILDPRFFSNNEVFVTGSFIDITREYDISSLGTGTFEVDLGVAPIDKEFINIYLDETLLSPGSFTFIPGSSTVTINILVLDTKVRSIVNHYTVPAIEVGDNISVQTSNTYTIIENSYSDQANNSLYNVALTTNNIFKVKFEQDLKSNLSGSTLVNISRDIQGTIANINTTDNTFTIDYDEIRFPGDINLANSIIYSVSIVNFVPIFLDDTRIICDIPQGEIFIKVRTKNTSGRYSPFVTASVNVATGILKGVDNIDIKEEIYLDTTQGVAVRLIISFDHIKFKDIVTYEISYRLDSEDADLENFNTVFVSAVGVDVNGRLRYTIDNINRGRGAAVNFITVKVTPITSVNIRGITLEKSQFIIGKTASPQNVENFTGGQNETNIIFSWTVPLTSDNVLVDLDLNEIRIRRVPGDISSNDLLTEWITAEEIAIIPTPSVTTTYPIDKYTKHTYLIRTYDTSGNPSATIGSLVLTTTRSTNIGVLQSYSESDPSSNVIVNFPNENIGEFNYPSFANSNSGGLTFSYTSAVDNANGTSTGWSVLAEPTDLLANGQAVYITQIRDIGNVIIGHITLLDNTSQNINNTFNDLQNTIFTGITEASPTADVLVETDFGGIGHVLGFNNANAASVTYDSALGTLVSGGIAGNVYAIWNPGQFPGDSSNTNSFAFIAGTINANAIALGETFFANGRSSGGNAFSNITAVGSSYQLTDFTQFVDSIITTFEGPDSSVKTNKEMRVAVVNPFFANGNVNTSTFTGFSTNDGYRKYTPFDDNFRYFQIKYTVDNKLPIMSDFTLDDLNYTVDLPVKNFSATINILTLPQLVDYSLIGYTKVPAISIIPLQDEPHNPVVVDRNTSNANIRVLNTNTGISLTNVNVSFTAQGI